MIGSIKTFLLWLLIISLSYAKTEPIDQCHPAVDLHQPQFIVGYGSLMQEKSKRENAVNVGRSHPIYLSGYKRAWIEHGTPIGFSTTYLAVLKQAAAKINAVYFQLNDVRHIHDYDKRENTYCRVAVLPEQMQTLGKETLLPGQYWIYITQHREKTYPSSRYPIVQSYVDIFLSGCFEMEEKYHLRDFARDCIQLTSNWSVHWVNDRIHPRRAFDDVPAAAKIDRLIASELPEYFKRIKIEGG